MLNMAIWFESQLGRNDGNPLYVTQYLKRVQHFCDVHTKRNLNDHLLAYFPISDKTGKPDVSPVQVEDTAKKVLEFDKDGLRIDHLRPYGNLKPYSGHNVNLWVDWGEDALKDAGILPYEVLECPKPMVYWASDTHIKTSNHDSYDYRLSMAKKADIVFVAQKDAVERMKKDGVDAIWLPHAVEPLAYPKQNFASKKYDVCFVGHINSGNRVEALDRLFKEVPNFFYGQRLFEQAAEIYGRSKIVFNISMTDDINMRTFEGMATGSALMTNWIPTIEELFTDGKDIILYRSLDEMVDKAKYYIAHDSEREKIAAAGYENVIKNHTFKNRVEKILEVVKDKLLTAV